MNPIFTDLSFFHTSLLVGIVFLFTGIAKLIEPWKFVDHISKLQLLKSRQSTVFTALIFTAIETALGVALILEVLPKIIIPVSILLLIGLMILTYWSTSTGRTEDCGCYNGWVKISPIQSLALDIIYIVLLIFAAINGNYQSTVLWKWMLVLATLVTSGALAFGSLEYFHKNGNPYIDLTPLRANRLWKPEWLGEDSNSKLMSGEKIVIFLSPQCPQCKKWLNVLKVVHYRDDLPEVTGAIAITKIEQGQQFVDSYGLNFPVLVLDQKQYDKLAIMVVPTAVLLEDGIIKEKWVGLIPEHFIQRIRQGNLSYPAIATS
ncbi:MAG: MauE/DoxX family redox-associated membrane protein [Cyanobacteria bacterium J06643_5]